MRRIEAILFDFGGTLDHDGVDWFSRLFAFFQSTNRLADRQEFYDLADEAAKAICSLKDTPTLSMAATVRRICDQILDRIHARNGHGSLQWEPEAASTNFVKNSQKYLERNRQILAQLRNQYRLGVISNNWGNTAGWCRQYYLDEYLETMIDSTVVGSVKPQPEIFQAALRELGLAPEQCIYVGDRYDCDVLGARTVGMLPIWIVGENHQNPMDNTPDLVRIRSLTQLPELDFSGSF